MNIDVSLEILNSNNLPSTHKITEDLTTLKEQLPSILDDYEKYYVFYNRNPEYEEYKRMFDNINSNIESSKSKLNIIANETDKNTEILNKMLNELDKHIQIEKKNNNIFKRKLGIVESTNSGSNEMISNYKDMYKIEYNTNWGLFISIIIALATITNVFTPLKIQNADFKAGNFLVSVFYLMVSLHIFLFYYMLP